MATSIDYRKSIGRGTVYREIPLYYPLLKRGMDIGLSLFALIVLSPFLLMIGAIIKLTSEGPIFFKQKRMGKNHKVFHMIKFRSMVANAEALMADLLDQNERDGPVFRIENDPRCTKIGNIMRKYSIDELPQLINILNGDMSIVGPRPPIVSEVEKYDSWHHKRFQVQPGLTCYWQIDLNRTMPFDDWVKTDIKYINNMSLLLDTLLIIKTIPVIFRGH
jgi:lipopolysaccharide/colanic/teichoic acid biosynthesis glycosyltransferase